MPDPFPGDFSPIPSEKAIAYFRSLVPVTDAEFASLSKEGQELAFRIAGVAQLDIVNDVDEAIREALVRGVDFSAFKDAVMDELTQAWGGEDPWHVETIFRTNVQTAYSAGRYDQQSKNKEGKIWEFSAVMDDRTSDICDELDGTTLPADDPAWDSKQPPLHYNCRSTIISHDEEDVPAGEVDDEMPDVEPDEGFGGRPGFDWKPNLDEYPADLASIARSRMEPEPEPVDRSIPVPEDVAKYTVPDDPLGQSLEFLEMRTADDPVETAVLVDSDGDVIFSKVGQKAEVGFTTREAEQFPDQILTHNHPSGGSLSLQDLVTASRTNLAEIRASGRGTMDGFVRTYSIKRPAKGWPKDWEIEDAFARARARARVATDKIVQDAMADGSAIGNQLFFSRINEKIANDIWELAAPDLGFSYTVNPELPKWEDIAK
jgi:SPP1 gp7 family putative phage head morphogenesis protein